MTVKSDRWIRRMAQEKGMIEPFAEAQKRDGVVSYGLSSYGYDARVGDRFKIFTPRPGDVLDPKNAVPAAFVEATANPYVDLPPRAFALAQTVEYFRIPRNVVTTAYGKSTYARCGLVVNVTPFEPEWEGYVTLSLVNTSDAPVRVYANEGIAQVLFWESDEACEVSYADRRGKYQKQTAITHARL